MTQEPSVQDSKEMAGERALLRRALAYLEGSDPLTMSGGESNAGLRANISTLLAAAPPPATSSAVEALREAIKSLEAVQTATLDEDSEGVTDFYEIAATGIKKLKAMASLQAGTEVAVKSLRVTDEMVDYALRYGGRCRDCADEFGICPRSGLPCDVDAARKAIRHVLDAIAYGTKHGFIEAALQAGTEVAVKASSLTWHNPAPNASPVREAYGYAVTEISSAGAAPVQQAGFPETLNFYISDSENGYCRVPKDKLIEVQEALSQLQQRIAEVEAENKRWQDNWDANVAEMSERFRAVNIQRVIEASGHDILALAARAEAAEAALKAKDAKLAEAVRLLEPFARFAEKAERFVQGRAVFGGDPVMPTKEFRAADFQRARSFTSSIQEKGNG